MFTNWQQVEEWIKDNNLERWIFTKGDRNIKREEGGTPNDKVVDSEYYTEDMAEKLAVTKKALLSYGGKLYGYGWNGKKQTDGMFCEVYLQEEQPRLPIGVGMAAAPVDEAAMEARLRKTIMQELELQRYENERKNFESEKKAFEDEKKSAIGMLVQYMAPVAQAMMAGRRPMVAGVDAPADVEAARIIAKDPEAPETETPEAEEESVFTDEEQERLYDLMARLKAVEPQYLELVEAVVKMAESKDPMYNTAKGFLIR